MCALESSHRRGGGGEGGQSGYWTYIAYHIIVKYGLLRKSWLWKFHLYLSMQLNWNTILSSCFRIYLYFYFLYLWYHYIYDIWYHLWYMIYTIPDLFTFIYITFMIYDIIYDIWYMIFRIYDIITEPSQLYIEIL